VIDRLARILVDAGASPVEAARAAVVLDAGGSVEEARAAMEHAPRLAACPADSGCGFEQPDGVVDDLVHALDSAARAFSRDLFGVRT
jgi:hypothetical protein